MQSSSKKPDNKAAAGGAAGSVGPSAGGSTADNASDPTADPGSSNPSSNPSTNNAVADADSAELARAAERSLRDVPGAFPVAGPGLADVPDDGEAAPPLRLPAAGHNYTNDNLPPNIDIIAEATLVQESVESQSHGHDTLGLGYDEEANLGGVMPDSASVAVSAITMPYTPLVPDRDVVHEAECAVPPTVCAPPLAFGPSAERHSSTLAQGGSDDGGNPLDSSENVGTDGTSPLAASQSTPPSNRPSTPPEPESAPIAHAEPMDKMSVYAFGTSFKFRTWHFVLLACLVLTAVVVPLAVVLPNKNEESEPSGAAEEQAQEGEGGETPAEVVVDEPPSDPPSEAVFQPDPMELPSGIVPDEECEYRLHETDSVFQIDSLSLNGEPVAVDEGAARGTLITARPGSRLRVKGKAATCSTDWCPGCHAQLYVSLVDYDDGRIYDPCTYMWAGQVLTKDLNVGAHPDIQRPPRDGTSECFFNRWNRDCPESEIDLDIVLDAEKYPEDGNATYSIVLSVSYEYQCQEDLKQNKLHILGVTEDYFLQVEGEPIEQVVAEPDEKDDDEPKRECDLELHEYNSTFAIEGVYLNDALVSASGEGSTSISAIPGDTIRVRGYATTCSWWCLKCVTQMYISLVSHDEETSLYDPCKYLWAPQAAHADLHGEEFETSLVRPSLETTSQCFVASRKNGYCDLEEFDVEFVVGDATAKYGIALSVSYEYYCQEYLLENKLRILDVSDDYVLQVEGEAIAEDVNGDETDTEECAYELHENDATFAVDEIYLNNVQVVAEEGSTSVAALPGDTIRIKGNATTCSWWCAGCVAQLYVSLVSYGEDASLYDPCKYLWAPQVVHEDFQGGDDEPRLIRPSVDMTNQCFVASMPNGDCILREFDEEFVLGDTTANYGIALSVSYEFECQESLLENKLRILDVLDGYVLQVEGEAVAEQQSDDETDSGECAYELHENDASFAIDEVYLNNALVTASEEGSASIAASGGDTIRVKGNATTCSWWCTGCMAQLYVSLVSYDEDGSLYDPCKYLWAPQVVHEDFQGGEGEPSLIRPSEDMTGQCFVASMSNGDCSLQEFDEEFVVGDATAKYGIALSVSYEFECQESLLENKLRILDVSDDYVLQVEGEAVVEQMNDDETGTEECAYELHENDAKFAIDEVYLNNVQVVAEEGPTSVAALPGDTIRIKGNATTCSWWCAGCVAQLYVSLVSYDEDESLYDPCKYLWAPQVVHEDFQGGEGEPSLIRPSEDMTGQCFVDTMSNGDCSLQEFDQEFVVGDTTAKYGIVLSVSYEFECQESLLENKLRILDVSGDYYVQVEQQQDEMFMR